MDGRHVPYWHLTVNVSHLSHCHMMVTFTGCGVNVSIKSHLTQITHTAAPPNRKAESASAQPPARCWSRMTMSAPASAASRKSCTSVGRPAGLRRITHPGRGPLLHGWYPAQVSFYQPWGTLCCGAPKVGFGFWRRPTASVIPS